MFPRTALTLIREAELHRTTLAATSVSPLNRDPRWSSFTNNW